MMIDSNILESDFAQHPASQSLRVCCYGSSASTTPDAYLSEARHLGYLLAKRGHVCVNGAGKFGCMAALNDGCVQGDGHVVGVIHEMWLVDGGGLRDGGAHEAFAPPKSGTTERTVIREMLVAGGDDLQERKRLLVDKANGLVVLPGGPGTWDELWEMACARGIGLTHLPIVCVNVDGYYEPFRQMLERAYRDKLIKLQPHELVHFEPTAMQALQWLERVIAEGKDKTSITLEKRSKQLREGTSFYHTLITPGAFSKQISEIIQVLSEGGPEALTMSKTTKSALSLMAVFGAGIAIGMSWKSGRTSMK